MTSDRSKTTHILTAITSTSSGNSARRIQHMYRINDVYVYIYNKNISLEFVSIDKFHRLSRLPMQISYKLETAVDIGLSLCSV